MLKNVKNKLVFEKYVNVIESDGELINLDVGEAYLKKVIIIWQ
jgi:hypothetical protein